MRNQKTSYCFLSNKAKQYYRAVQQPNGDYSISKNSQPYPLSFNPSNLLESPVEFGTNFNYFSLVRSIIYPLDFIKDGAAILRNLYLKSRGISEDTFLTVIDWNGRTNLYELAYYGKIDFSEKEDEPKSGRFTVPLIDDTAWGLILENDDVEYAIDCSPSNPNAIKVLIDSITLVNRYTFQTVNAPIINNSADNGNLIPFVLVNEDGDSSGVIAKSQTYEKTNNLPLFVTTSKGAFFETLYELNNVNIQGSFQFSWSTNTQPSGGIIIRFYTNLGQVINIFANGYYVPPFPLVPGKIYNIDFDFDINFQAGERIFFTAELNDNAARLFTITPIVTNVFVSTKTKAEPQIVYCLPPLYVAKQLVSKITNGRFTIESDYFTENSNLVLTSGDAIRGLENAKIYTSYRDFFDSYDSKKFMAHKIVNGVLHLELATKVYPLYQSIQQAETLFDLGELISFKSSPAKEYYVNEIKTGTRKQDYRHPSGKLEVNSENTFSVPILNVNKELDIVSKYRDGCYDIMFLILDYRGGSTQDNTGDKSVYMIDITNRLISAEEDISTFINVNINNATLAPIIKSPLNNDLINNDLPIIRGVGIVGNNVSIYVFDVLDGSTIVDANGNWSYQIVTPLSSYDPGVATGQHDISASYTDFSGVLNTISIVVDTTQSSETAVTYPRMNDSLYNNKPLIKGVAEPGTNVDIRIDGIIVSTVVADNSCKWEYKSGVISNGNHIVTANNGLATSFFVDSFVEFPLITYFGSELDGFVVVNNLPLIEGVAEPGTEVEIWIDYIPYSYLGVAIADSNGNWSFQVIPISYIDPLSGLPVTLAPIKNGLSVISTSLINHSVAINSTGFQLNRPNYSLLTGVTDNTVFNTELSPKKSLLARSSLFSAMLQMQLNDKILFQTADKNSRQVTVLNGVRVGESEDISANTLGTPIAMLEYAVIKANAYNSFAKTLEYFNQGGIITCKYRGQNLYLLPIGGMKMQSIRDSIQEWKLLISPLTTYNSLLNLYKNGLIINLMKNRIFHSDYNSMHCVEYDFQKNPKYNFKDMYEDWFSNRNDAWLLNPQYIQKFQRTEAIIDQIIVNGVSDVWLDIYRCFDKIKIASIKYNPLTPAPIDLPEVVLQASVNWGDYPAGQYFCVMRVGDDFNATIFERVETRDVWENTILIESGNSVNKVGAFYNQSFKTIIRVEGLVKKAQPNVQDIISVSESGNSKLLWSETMRDQEIRFGTAYGLPDYLYLKIANALTNDDLKIEGINYVLKEDEKITHSEDVNGHPLYYYNVMLNPQENPKGGTFAGDPDFDKNGVFLNVDGTAFGRPVGVIVKIDLPNG